MKAYFVGIITVAFLGGMIVSIMPGGATQRYLRLLCGLCVSASIVLPLFSLLSQGRLELDLNDIFVSRDTEKENNYNEIYNNSIKNAEEKTLENILKNEIIQEFDAKYEDIDIEISIEEKSDEFYISEVFLKIHASGVLLDPHAMKEYVDLRLSCDSTVVYV